MSSINEVERIKMSRVPYALEMGSFMLSYYLQDQTLHKQLK